VELNFAKLLFSEKYKGKKTNKKVSIEKYFSELK